MDPIFFVILFSIFAVLGLTAQAWGADSRGFTVDSRYPERVGLS